MTGHPFDDRDGVIWLDGAFRPWREARLHVLSHGLHYASSVFEGERIYGGRVFRLREHTRRLLRSAGLLGFALPFDAGELEAATCETVAASGLGDGYVRPIAWLGPEDMGIGAPGARAHVAIAVWSWPNLFGPGRSSKRGITLQVAPWRRPPSVCAPVQAKAAGLYTICTMSRRRAEQGGYDDALMLDHRGNVAEATGANLFLVRDGVLVTPPPETFLDGITRRTVIGLAGALGIPTVERPVAPLDLDDAEEVFLTGTAYEVQPVAAIEQRRYAVGPVTRRLEAAYADHVRSAAVPA